MGPTTTDWDRMMVAVLCQIAQVKDINALVKAQFKAKSKELESKYYHHYLLQLNNSR